MKDYSITCTCATYVHNEIHQFINDHVMRYMPGFENSKYYCMLDGKSKNRALQSSYTPCMLDIMAI